MVVPLEGVGKRASNPRKYYWNISGEVDGQQSHWTLKESVNLGNKAYFIRKYMHNFDKSQCKRI